MINKSLKKNKIENKVEKFKIWIRLIKNSFENSAYFKDWEYHQTVNLEEREKSYLGNKPYHIVFKKENIEIQFYFLIDNYEPNLKKSLKIACCKNIVFENNKRIIRLIYSKDEKSKTWSDLFNNNWWYFCEFNTFKKHFEDRVIYIVFSCKVCPKWRSTLTDSDIKNGSLFLAADIKSLEDNYFDNIPKNLEEICKKLMNKF